MMSTTTLTTPPPANADGTPHAMHRVSRLRAALATVGAAVLGAAPHVLHHVGPLAGAAILGGAGGKLLFGALGFIASVPMLRHLHRRTGSWRVPGGVLALMAVMFTFSSLVIGPALTGGDGNGSTTKPAGPGVTTPAPTGHGSHHG
jgi:hypothetical protein